MVKKIVVIILVLAILFTLVSVGYKNEPTLIVYLGDSIAEGIAGMSPISERERYAYYGILGIRNGYKFRNRAVSGHKSIGLLNLIQKEDSNAYITQTLLKKADIIHISILGNDLLLNDLGQIIISAANEDYTIINDIIDDAAANFEQIVDILNEYNPDAVLMFQNVYNPIFEDSWLINNSARNSLENMGISESQYRELASIILSKLNGIITDYMDEHPGKIHLLDAYNEFQNIYEENERRGERLISVDNVHPSSEGHGVLADLTQRKLEQLDLADRKYAIENYKEMKKEQLNRMYADSLNVDAVSSQIDKAKSCSEITKIYFNAIKNKTPVYS